MTGRELIIELLKNDNIDLDKEVALATTDGPFEDREYAMFHIQGIKNKNDVVTLLMFDDIRFKENSKMNWISVKDRLPDESGFYLVCGKNTIWISEFLILGNMIGGWCGKPDKPLVEAWMPLPRPCKEGENE